MSRFLADRLRALAPYTPGEQPQDQTYIKLNTNESPYPPAPGVSEAVAAQAQKLNLYSDPAARMLVEPLAQWLGVTPGEVYVGNGSDEILAFLFAAFCPQGAAFADITYGFYPVYAQLWQLDTTVIPLKQDFTLAPESFLNINRTVFIANPNAPTGLAFTREEICKIVQWNPANLVVVDEAYVDFGAESAVPLTQQYDNLLVVGTFSKSRSLAGGRLGYAVGKPDLIADLARIQYSFNPYNVNRMTMAAGAAAVLDTEYFAACTGKIVQTRARTLQILRCMGFVATQSLANFVFVRHPALPGEQLYHALRSRGVLVRWFNRPRIHDYLRITIGTDEQMDKLFEALRQIIQR